MQDRIQEIQDKIRKRKDQILTWFKLIEKYIDNDNARTKTIEDIQHFNMSIKNARSELTILLSNK